jgi:hypothetical protein
MNNSSNFGILLGEEMRKILLGFLLSGLLLGILSCDKPSEDPKPEDG